MLNFSHFKKQADAYIISFWKGDKIPQLAVEKTKGKNFFKGPIELGDFTGKEKEISFLYEETPAGKRTILLGLGNKEKISIEKLRRIYGSLAKYCREKKFSSLNIATPIIPSLDEEEVIHGITEGILFVNYGFDKLRHDVLKESPTHLLKEVGFDPINKLSLEVAQGNLAIFLGVNIARDLVNNNADEVTPQYLVNLSKSLSKKSNRIKTTVFDKRRIEKEGMGLILAVNRGSVIDPAFIIIEYRGDPKSKDLTAIVGKGITYDTGGLHLKTSNMETMKCDMAGAAACIGTIIAAANLQLKVNVTAVIPTTENSIGPRSYKMGDVYKSYSGKTVEILDTDAEGRLILADALTYVSRKIKPNRIIDLATLTGSIEIALGPEASGLFSNDDDLANALVESGEATFERLWRMPLFEEYLTNLKSDIADLKNAGGRPGGAVKASVFLQQFVENNIPWAHFDIAATAFLSEPKHYHSKYATAVGVRLLIDYLSNKK